VAPTFTSLDEFGHWLLPRDGVVNTFVVEDPITKVITDMVSFYTLPSTVVNHPEHKQLKAAYSFYNVAAVTPIKALMEDALTLAKQVGDILACPHEIHLFTLIHLCCFLLSSHSSLTLFVSALLSFSIASNSVHSRLSRSVALATHSLFALPALFHTRPFPLSRFSVFVSSLSSISITFFPLSLHSSLFPLSLTRATRANALDTQDNFDVFNALDLMENSQFLEDLKFGKGDGNLQYYLYNYRLNELAPGELGLVLL